MSLVRMCLSLSVILSAFLSACPSPCVVSCPLHVSIPSLTSDPFFCRPQSQSGRSTLWESGSRQHTTWVMIRCRHQNLVNENVMSEPTCFFNRYASAQAATHSTNFVHANTTSSSPSPCKTQLLLLLPTPPFLHLSPFKLSLSLNPLTSRPLDLSTSRPLSLNHTHTHTHTHSLSLSLSLSLCTAARAGKVKVQRHPPDAKCRARHQDAQEQLHGRRHVQVEKHHSRKAKKGAGEKAQDGLHGDEQACPEAGARHPPRTTQHAAV